MVTWKQQQQNFSFISTPPTQLPRESSTVWHPELLNFYINIFWKLQSSCRRYDSIFLALRCCVAFSEYCTLKVKFSVMSKLRNSPPHHHARELNSLASNWTKTQKFRENFRKTFSIRHLARKYSMAFGIITLHYIQLIFTTLIFRGRSNFDWLAYWYKQFIKSYQSPEP